MDASQTPHPTDKTLNAYGLGKLDDPTAQSVHKHLESCPDCRRRVAELTSDSFVGRLRDAQGRPDSPAHNISSTGGLSMLAAGPGSSAPPPASTLPPGLADHPDYEITRELGRGGMGVVYLAQNKIMGRTEVLKVVSGHLLNRRGVVDRFLAEIRNAARLRHPNIVTAYSVLRVGESLVLAMEHVEGLDLAKMVQARGPLPVANACNYVHQAALGLQHAHEHGMVHRDIKPSNLMLTRQGNRALIKVLDFGLAKVQREGAVDGGLTHEGQMLGTPDYIAPEQISDARRADIRADIYSLGCTLYYLLTGGPPFEGTSLYDILQAHHSMEATPLNLARPEVPVELAALVAKMMAKEPERRFQTPNEVADALKPFFKSGNLTAAGSRPALSHTGRPKAEPATGGAGSGPRPRTTESAPAAAPPGNAPAQSHGREPVWESLVDRKGTEPVKKAASTAASNQRPPWLWPAVAAGVLLLGLVAVWGVLIKIWTTNGIIILEDLPDQATVLVDGKKATVHWPDGGGLAEITVAPGDHEVQVKKDGFTVRGQIVTVEAGRRKLLTARLEPLETSPPKKGDADAGPVRPSVGKRPMPPATGTVIATSPTPPPNRAAAPDTNPTVVVDNKAGKVDVPGRVANEPARPQPQDMAKPVDGPAIILSGLWRHDGEDLVQTESTTPSEEGSGTEGVILFGQPSLSKYDLTFKAMIEEGHEGFGAIYHCEDRNNMCSVFWGKLVEKSLVNQCSFVRKGNAQIREAWTRPSRAQPGEWYDILLQVRDSSITCLVDGKEWFQYDDARSTNGRVGFRTKSSAVRFRDISLTTPEGKPLLKGPPRLPKPTTSTPLMLSGSWRAEGNELVQADKTWGTTGALLLGDPSLFAYDLRFEAKVTSGRGQFYALFHQHGNGNGGYLHVGNTNQVHVDLYFRQNGKPAGPDVDREMRIEQGRWYEVLVKVRGQEIWCSVGGQVELHCIDAPFANGMFGFGTFSSEVRFRNIQLATAEGRVFWKGLPDLPDETPGGVGAPHSE